MNLSPTDIGFLAKRAIMFDSMKLRGSLVLGVALLGLTFSGCNTRYDGDAPKAEANGEQTAEETVEVTTANGTESVTVEASGWPAGEDATETINALGEEIRSIFDAFTLVEETQFYPIGFSKFKRVINELDVEVDEDATPPTAKVHINYTKHFTLLHDSQEAAEQDTEMYAANPVQTLEVMMGRLNPKQLPITLDLTYELEGDRWVRTDAKTEPKFKDSNDVPGQMKLP